MKPRMTAYTLVGSTVLLMLVLLGRYALHDTTSEFPAARTEATAPHRPPRDRPIAPGPEWPAETPSSQPSDSMTTNAADLYRQAFALFNALSEEEKDLTRSWETKLDVTIELGLCGKIRPICDLMHRASNITNCDWGIGPINYDTPLPHFASARALSRVAVWSEAHCHSNDAAGATEDALAVLRLGQNVSQSGIIGTLVDLSMQDITMSSVAANLSTFRGEYSQRLIMAFSDSAYDRVASHAMEEDAEMVDRYAQKLAALPAAQAEDELLKLTTFIDKEGSRIPQSDAAGLLKQVSDSERELAKALASGSVDDYEAWLEKSTQLKESNVLAKVLIGDYDRFVEKMQRYEVRRAMMVAALLVMQEGPLVLQYHPDPSTGEPFFYTETADGFELQSKYQSNDQPLKMRFR